MAMTESELLALIGQYEKSALGSSAASGPTVGGQLVPKGFFMNNLELDRYEALNAYYGRPLGNEVADRSQVVLPELRDTIEWIMPQLMSMFAATQRVCQFDPAHPGDEDQSEIETDVVNAIFMKENNGFFILHDFFKDALLLRNGYAKVDWVEEEKTDVEKYTGLDENELTELLTPQDESEIEVIEQTEKQAIQMTPMGQQVSSSFDIKIRRTTTEGKVSVECCPPEEILVSAKARQGLEKTPFVEHKTKATKSKLREMGFDTSKVDKIGQASPDWTNLIALARNEVTDQLAEQGNIDEASTDVDFREIYIRVDYDGDGKSELRRIFMGGEVILENEECEEIQLSSCSPIRMPHRHVGISYYDILMDLQVIKTTLFRQGLDNLYAGNNQRVAVNYNTVNLDDLLVSRPNGVVRVNGSPGADIMQLPTTEGVLPNVIQGLEYVDSLREMRTGIGKDTQGVDADALQDVTKGGQLAAMSAAAKKTELVARLLAEGVKDIFLKIHSTIMRHQDKPFTVQISGKWVDVDPTTWRRRSSCSVNIGLGSGNREEARNNIVLLGQIQGAAAQYGLVGPKQIYETSREAIRLLGFDSHERFILDPDSIEYQQMQQQKGPPPEMMKLQAEAQLQQAKTQADFQLEQFKAQQAAQLEAQRQQLQAAQLQDQNQIEAQRSSFEAQQESVLKQQQFEMENRLKNQELAMEDRWKLIDAQVRLATAQIGATKGLDDMTGQVADEEAVSLAQSLQDLAAALGELKKPRKVVRDANGKIAGVE